MDDKLKQEVYDLINKAQAEMNAGNYYGVSLKTETDCVRQAYADAADPDGYPGKIFNRWFADVLGSKKAVPGEDFI